MESIIEDLEKIVGRLDYGDITKDDVVSGIELAIQELREHESNN